ncbi:MAG TPA: hypothetical protein VJU87_12250 [Gemmatimonadaceae bacterium]|nr:hypothetical protein [Gemmatimonadaceae bacterium]
MSRLRARAGSTLALLGSLLGACRGGAHQDEATVVAKQVAADVPQIEKAVGVRFRRPPRFEIRTRAQVRSFLIRQLDDSATQRDLTGKEAAYKVLGLIPDTMHLKKLIVNLYSEQILGYYDPATKVLYIVQGAPDEYRGITIMHELVHALQDQYIDLDSLQHVTGNDDRAAAAQAVIEGEATYEQLAIMLGGRGNIASGLPGGWERMREQIRESQSAEPVFSAAPMAIQEELLFPYINGAEFVRRYKEARPGALPFRDMPASTEQVLHAPTYFHTPRDAPVRVALPAVPHTVYENVLGEFETRLVLYQQLQDQNTAIRAAAGWAGDRYVIVQTAAGNGIAWVSVWDSALDAAEFVDALGQAVQHRYRAPASTAGPNGVRRYAGTGRTVVVTPREIGGRNVVLVVDVPAAASPNVLDLARVAVGG